MMKWCVPEGRRLLWREWDGEAVVFNRQSCQTHYLNVLAAEALHLLEEAPRTAEDLAAALSDILGENEHDRLCQQMRQLTSGFARLGLIDPCPA